MKHNLLNFTRGSQLLGHFGFMFAAGLKGPLIVTLLVVVGLVYWEVSSNLTQHQLYLLWMHLYAMLYGFMEFDPDKLVTLRLASEDPVSFPISVIREFPPMREAVAAFTASAMHALKVSALVLVPLFAAFWWFAEAFGERSKQKKHVRGSSLATLAELESDIARHNARERAREYTAELGRNWRLAGASALRKAGLYSPAHLAGISWPWRREQSHAMLVGTTGTGKTVALTELVSEIRERGERAVIFDLTGAFIETFFDPERDVILNPLDDRCPSWSVFNDCTTSAEFHAAAESIVPHDGGGSEQFWVLAARTMFVETCLKLASEGRGANHALAAELMNADLSDLHKLLEDTMAGPITTPSAAKMAESVRAVFNVNAKAMQLLPSTGEQFSVRDWVRGDCELGSILFLSARYVDMSVLSQLLTLWLDTAINTLMSGKRTRDLKLWFLIDELGALHRLPSLEKGLQTARNFGGAIVTGVHTFAKLKEVYGENMAMTLSSLARTKLILATADRETATWCSDVIGHREVREMEEGYSYGYNNARDAVSLTPRRQVVPLLLPDEFMDLPSLAGYIKFPDGFPAAPVSLTPKSWPRVAEGFVARDLAKVRPIAAPAYSGTMPSANSEESGDQARAEDSGEPRSPEKKDAKAQRKKQPQANRSAEKKDGPTVRILAEKCLSDVTREGIAQQEQALAASGAKDGRQSELPLENAPTEKRSQGQPPLSPIIAKNNDLGRQEEPRDTLNDADRKLQEQQQKALLGGAARENPDHDVGEIEPDM